jgi:hypothetical protein
MKISELLKKATKRPWSFGVGFFLGRDTQYATLQLGNDFIRIECGQEETEKMESLRLIAHCVNNFEGLLEAAKEISLEYSTPSDGPRENAWKIWKKFDAAIKRAEEAK